MTTKRIEVPDMSKGIWRVSVTNVKPVVGKDGKTRLVRKTTLFSGAKSRKAARLEKAWKGKSKP